MTNKWRIWKDGKVSCCFLLALRGLYLPLLGQESDNTKYSLTGHLPPPGISRHHFILQWYIILFCFVYTRDEKNFAYGSHVDLYICNFVCNLISETRNIKLWISTNNYFFRNGTKILFRNVLYYLRCNRLLVPELKENIHLTENQPLRCFRLAASHISPKYTEGRLIGLVMSWVGAVFWNTLLQERQKEGMKWREEKEEDVSSYWMTSRKREDFGNWKRNH